MNQDQKTSSFAQVKSICLNGLAQNSEEEKLKLISAAREDGIFYLNLPQNDGEVGFREVIQRIKNLDRDLFRLPLKDKMEFDIDKLGKLKLNGYKPIGRNIGGNDGKERDGFETYALPVNGIFELTNDPFPHPEVVDDYMGDLKSFVRECSNIVHIILGVLSDSLRLPDEKCFESYHRSSFPSPSIVRLLRYAPGSPPSAANINTPSVPHTPHTDLGTITLLFADSPGLQILPDGTDTWLDIQPKPGLIVNFGDALSLLTGGYFRSVLHRVASSQGKGMGERYSLAFMQRPENHTPMRPLPSPLLANTSLESCGEDEDEHLTCETWINAKFGALRGNFDVCHDKSVVSGGRKFVPGWQSQAVASSYSS